MGRGDWKALREVFPETTERRCWWPENGRCACGAAELGSTGAKAAIVEICNAETRDRAVTAVKTFAPIVSAGIQRRDADTGQPLGQPLTGHTSFVFSVAFSPDGKRIVSGSADNTLRLWPAYADATMLCDKLTTNMSHKQWRDWVSPDIDYIKVCPDLPVAPD